MSRFIFTTVACWLLAFGGTALAQEGGHDHDHAAPASAAQSHGNHGDHADHAGHGDPAPTAAGQQDTDHSGHSMDHSGHAMDHSAHAGQGPAPAATGSWSYQGRETPPPHTDKRWEVVPVPEYGHAYVSVEGVSQALRCAALLNNPRVMVDRATRQACGAEAEAAPRPAPAAPAHQH